MNTHSSGYPQTSHTRRKGMEMTKKLFGVETFLTQNMQDKQTQVRAGPARADGRLRETDGMVPDRSDAAAATHQWASSELIRARGELSSTEKTWLQKTRTLSFSQGFMFLRHYLNFVFLLQAGSRLLRLRASPSLCRGKVSQRFSFLNGGFGLPLPLYGIKGGGGSPLIIHLFCVSSLSLIPCLPPSLHSPKSHHFYFHSLPDPPCAASRTPSFISLSSTWSTSVPSPF